MNWFYNDLLRFLNACQCFCLNVGGCPVCRPPWRLVRCMPHGELVEGAAPPSRPVLLVLRPWVPVPTSPLIRAACGLGPWGRRRNRYTRQRRIQTRGASVASRGGSVCARNTGLIGPRVSSTRRWRPSSNGAKAPHSLSFPGHCPLINEIVSSIVSYKLLA